MKLEAHFENQKRSAQTIWRNFQDRARNGVILICGSVLLLTLVNYCKKKNNNMDNRPT